MILECPECGSDMVLRRSKYGKFYRCATWPECDGSHGAHLDGKPLGIPANKETKEWRIKAHNAFDKLWGRRKMKRKKAYKKLAAAMGMAEEDCHVGRFDIEQCKQVIEICEGRN